VKRHTCGVWGRDEPPSPSAAVGALQCLTVRLADLIVATRPAVWIHGHVHAPMQYRLDHTWVVSNPLGFPHEALLYDVGARFEV
jgi:hypothetical protein